MDCLKRSLRGEIRIKQMNQVELNKLILCEITVIPTIILLVGVSTLVTATGLRKEFIPSCFQRKITTD